MATDYSEPGRGLRFDRAYAFRTDMPSQGSFGSNWRAPTDRQVVIDGLGQATVYLEGGQQYLFKPSGASFVATDGRSDTLSYSAAGDLVWSSPTGEQTSFRASPSTGAWSLSSIKNRAGGSLLFAYNQVQGALQLATISDETGRTISVTWSNGLITHLAFPDGTTADYGYVAVTSAAGLPVNMLQTVTRSLGSAHKVLTYLYEDAAMGNALTGVTDERGKRFATWTWDDPSGRATSSKLGSITDLTSITYNDTAMTRTVTNGLNRSEVYQFGTANNAWTLTGVTGNATAHCPASARSLSYTNGYISSSVNEVGSQTTYQRDATGRETSRTEAASTSSARTIGTTWSTVTPYPSKIVTPLSTTDLNYTAPAAPSNGASTSPHRYWRVRFNGSVQGSGDIALAEVEASTLLGSANGLRIGSPDTSPVSNGQGLAYATDGFFGSAESYDGLTHDIRLTGQTAAIYMDFGASPQVLNHVVLTGMDTANAALDSAGIDVQYSETGGSTDAFWSTAWSATGLSAWANFQRRRLDRPGYTDPTYHGSPYGAHRYWRVTMLDCVTPYYTFAVSEVEFRATPGGVDQTGAGTAFASNQYDSGFGPANAFDKTTTTSWASASFQHQSPVKWNNYIGYDFGAGHAVSVAQVMLRSRSEQIEAAEQAPSLWMLQYSDDGSVWSTAAQFTDTTAWGLGEARTYTDPLYVP